MKRQLLALGLVAVSMDLAAAGIYKCTSPTGGVTYQETACDGAQTGGVAKSIPTVFPEVNTVERDRTLRALELLQQRELLRYDIDSRERVAMAGIAAREREAQMAANSSGGDPYAIGYGAWGGRLVPIMAHRTHVQHHTGKN